jgi:RNA polymerase sigma factor (sigma-70 family)
MAMDEADAQVYEKYADELIRFATALTGPSMAEDVLSDAMLRVFASPSWKAVKNKRAYLHRAVLNEALQARRSIDRRLRREQLAAGRPPSESSFADRLELLDALRRLSMRQRAVVYLTYWIGLDASEIARALDISLRTVERELSASRRRLEVLLR